MERSDIYTQDKSLKYMSQVTEVWLFCYLVLLWTNQSGIKPNLVAKIWLPILPTLVTICNGLPKLVANISSHTAHLVNTGLAVGSLVKWLQIKVAITAN